MNKALIIIGLALFFKLNVSAQTDIFGTISNAKTGSEIEEAHIFIASTTISTVTNSKGLYLLENIPKGHGQLIVYGKGFEPIIKEHYFDGSEKFKLSFDLKPVEKETINSVSEKKKKRFLKNFTEAVLGYSKNANKCTIENPEALTFRERKDGTLDVIADDLIIIDNSANGYKMRYLLKQFSMKNGELARYSGKIYFEEKMPEEVKDVERWDRNRIKQYFGSFQHFLSSLRDNKLEQNGFKIYEATLANTSQFIELGETNIQKVYELNPESQESALTISNYLKVVFENEKDDISQKIESMGKGVSHLISPSFSTGNSTGSFVSGNSKDVQISYINANYKKVQLNEKGYPLKSELLRFYGFWDYEGLADLVPLDYLPNTEKEETKIDEYVPEIRPTVNKNDFEIINSLVRTEYIKESGLAKEARPSIDNPNFVRSAQAREFLKDDDLVVGVTIDDVSRAYPIRILNLHEVVNDEFDGKPITVTYSPLCRSAMAFSGESKSGIKTFASSGLLFNNAILLFDKETNSLWSQIMGRAITGSESGNPLEIIPSIITTFKNWRKLHPGSSILSSNTGFDIDYNQKPYSEYQRNQEVKFHVMRSSDNLPNKEMVLGVQIGYRTKAYPFSELRKTNGKLSDSINGRQYTVHYDDASSSAWVTDRKGQELNGTSMYWFAWYAFHPETDVFWND